MCTLRLAYSILHGHLASASSFYQIYAQLGYNRTDIYTLFGSSTTVEPWLDHSPLVPILSAPFFLIGGVSPRVLPIIFCSLIALEIFVLLRYQLILAWISVIVWVAYVFTSPLLSMLFLDAGVSFFLMSTLVLVKEFGSKRISCIPLRRSNYGGALRFVQDLRNIGDPVSSIVLDLLRSSETSAKPTFSPCRCWSLCC